MTLNICIPCSRPENLEAIFKNLLSEDEISHNRGIMIIAWLVFDADLDKSGIEKVYRAYQSTEAYNSNIHFHFDTLKQKNNVAGHAARNLTLNKICNPTYMFSGNPGYFYSLDDDNILHPYLIPYIADNLTKIWQHDLFIFSQLNANGTMRLNAAKNCIVPGHIDTAMFMVRVDKIGQLRFDESDYCADGKFIQQFYEAHPNVLVEKKPLCYYNFLR